MFPFDASSIDKSLPVPVGTQLHGLLSYVLSHGDMPFGTRLPSVRQLAADLGIAPATVSQVYQQLRDSGLVEMRRGTGAFTVLDPHERLPEHLPDQGLRADVDALIGKAERLGVSATTLVSMITAQAQLRRPGSGLKLVFAGIFVGPTQDYVDEIRPALAASDSIRIVTLEQLQGSEAARQLSVDADLVLTFVHREKEVAALIPEARILPLRFIPSERTRQRLAGLDPRARIAAVTHFRDYIAVMRPSIREFAPHVADIRVTWSTAPDLAEIIASCDTVVYATGADQVTKLVGAKMQCFEYRHAPDQGAVENILVPYLAELRRTKAGEAQALPARQAATG